MGGGEQVIHSCLNTSVELACIGLVAYVVNNCKVL